MTTPTEDGLWGQCDVGDLEFCVADSCIVMLAFLYLPKGELHVCLVYALQRCNIGLDVTCEGKLQGGFDRGGPAPWLATRSPRDAVDSISQPHKISVACTA